MSTKFSPPLAPAVLVRVPGDEGVAKFAQTFTIGRDPENDLVVKHEIVSQRHVEVSYDGGRWWVRDLESTNGTIVGGKRIERVALTGTLLVRLGAQGPAVVLTPEGASAPPETTLVVEPPGGPSASQVVERYFARRAPESMGRHTAAVRHAVRQRRKKYWIALAVVGVLAAGAGAYGYMQHRRVERTRAAAAELFYAMKALELDVARLQASAAERQAIRERREDLRRQYRDYLEDLGIYGSGTAEPVQVVYQVVHRFGESEVNVPREFVNEVLRYIERWKRGTRLEEAFLRSQQHGYGPRIVTLMLEQDMPPDFFYLALQESSLKLEAVGPPTRFGYAKGMWQLIPGTAREYGLKTGPLVGQRRLDPMDERHDFEKSTRAAARYLRDIYTTDAQASGLLVVASYNWGQTNVLRLIRELPATPRERNFWKLLTRYGDRIPRETRDYVFAVVSAAAIGENPQLFGFALEPPLPRPDEGADVAAAP
jgi:hypothetical protein